jgi:hypothetical protein
MTSSYIVQQAKGLTEWDSIEKAIYICRVIFSYFLYLYIYIYIYISSICVKVPLSRVIKSVTDGVHFANDSMGRYVLYAGQVTDDFEDTVLFLYA